jgi:DNA-binding PucR family transcriptional regulator
MITGAEMVDEVARNTRVLKRNLAGFTKEKSLIRMSGGGNSLNWVLGHLLKSRLDLLHLLGSDPDELGERIEPYRRAREGGYKDDELMTLEELIFHWDRIDERLRQALPGAEMNGDGGEFGTLGKAVLFYCFHEGYHIGQAGILRRAVGLEGQIR